MEPVRSAARTPWPDMLFAAALAAGCLWYLWDSYSVSARTANLLLVLPASLLAVGLCGAVILEDVLAARKTAARARAAAAAEAPDRTPDAAPGRPPVEWRVVATMVLLAVYVFALVPLGFDVATFAYVAAMLVVLRQSGWIFILVYSAAFTALNVWLQQTTSYNIPLLVM